eukprot:1160127-Pelagomonas_calceolata.AAC.8
MLKANTNVAILMAASTALGSRPQAQHLAAMMILMATSTALGSRPQAQRLAAAGGRGMGGLYAGRGAGRANMYNQMLAQQSYGMPGYGAYPPGPCGDERSQTKIMTCKQLLYKFILRARPAS